MRSTSYNLPFAASSFLADHGIEVGNVSRSYLDVPCPFCHGSSTSPTPLGFHRTGGFVHCWRCPGGSLLEAISKLLNVSYAQAEAIRAQYTYRDSTVSETITYAPTCPIPGGPLTPRYQNYLESRGFDPAWVALEYGVLAAGPHCRWYGASRGWKGSDFSDRLIVPIHDRHGRAIAFQGRTIRKAEKTRWRFPPLDKVAGHYKDTLYGAHRGLGDTVAVVEGIMDSWKLGRGSVASYGTSMSQEQVRTLGKFRRVVFLFDSEPEAQARARMYGREIAVLGARVDVVDLGLPLGPSGKAVDLGDLGESEIQAIRKELGI